MALFLYIFVVFCIAALGSRDLQHCADSDCKEPISEAEAIITFSADVEDKVSFKKGDKVVVYSKSDSSLWGVEVNGNRGFAPKKFLKEKRTFHKFLKYIVPIKESDDSVDKSGGISQEDSDGPLVNESFDVIDGTRIYANSTDDVLETEPISTSFSEIKESASTYSPEITNTVGESKIGDSYTSIFPQSTHDADLKVIPTKFNSDDHGISPHDQIKPAVEKWEENTSSMKVPEILEQSALPFYTKPDTELASETKATKDPVQENIAEDVQDNILDSEGDDETSENEDDENEDNFEEDSDDVESEEVNEEEENEEPVENNDSNSKTLDMDDNIKTQSDVGTNVIETVMEDKQENEKNKFTHLSVEDDNYQLKLHEDSSVDEDTQQDDVASTGNVQSEEQNVDSLNTTEDSEKQNNVNSSFHDNESLKSSQSFNKVISPESVSDIVSDSSQNRDDQSSVTNPVSDDPQSVQKENLNIFLRAKEESEQFINIHNEEQSHSTEEETIAENNFIDMTSTATGVPEETSNDANPNDVYQETTEAYSTMVDNMKEVENDVTEKSLGHEGTDDTQKTEGSPENKRNSDNLPLGHIDHMSEVQETSEEQTPGYDPKSDLPEQLSSTLDVVTQGWLGWLAALTKPSNLELPSVTRTTMDGPTNSFDTLVVLMITAISVVIFSLGYYYIEKQRRDGCLIAKISSLEKELMVSSQEKFVLNDELQNAKDKLQSFGNSVAEDSEETSVLKAEFEECKSARFELEEQVASLEKELEAATEAGLELNRMMSELLTAQHGSDTLLQSVEHLQKQLDSQQTTIGSMNARLSAKTLQNENLQSELNVSSNRIISLEEQLTKVKETLAGVQKEKLERESDFKLKNQFVEKQLMETLESKSADSQQLQSELDALQDMLDETRKSLVAKEGEVAALRESLSQAECLTSNGDSSISLDTLLDVGNLRAHIAFLSKERDDLKDKLQGEEDARKLLEDHMKIVSEEVATLRTKYEEADHGKTEAQTRLEILSNYFKEKETQLQKELGLQEAMYIQKEGDALTTIEQIKAFQEEVENYKSQNEILKKEIIDQERSMKSQIAMLEKKVHENWVAARQAERRLEESKQEASQLRNRLTLSGRRLAGTIPGPEMGKSPDRELEYNGEMSSSPAHLGESQELKSSPMHYGLPASPPLIPPSGQQLPPGPFPNLPLFLPPNMPFPMPPPPGNMFPDDLRPPPLGRMSSPPPEPHSSFSPFDNSPPMSPLGRPYRSPVHYEDSPSRFHQSLQSSGSFSYSSPYPSSKWDEPPRSSFRPLHRDSPRKPKGSTVSSGHSSESLDKGSRHSDRV